MLSRVPMLTVLFPHRSGEIHRKSGFYKLKTMFFPHRVPPFQPRRSSKKSRPQPLQSPSSVSVENPCSAMLRYPYHDSEVEELADDPWNFWNLEDPP